VSFEAAYQDTQHLDTHGYRILRGAVPHHATQAAQRRLWHEITRGQVTQHAWTLWHEDRCWFPALRHEPEILALETYIPTNYTHGQRAEPQILWQPPDEATTWPLELHIDEPPPWADGRQYRTIVCVALTSQHATAPGRTFLHTGNGGLVLQDRDGKVVAPELSAGDLLVMHPQTPHSGTLNSGDTLRAAVYLRYLEGA